MSEAPGTDAAIRRTARDGLGFDQLRPGQEEAVRSALSRDTLVVMRTGAGKSGVYQVTAAMLAGATVVVSPTIALQADQVAALDAARVGDAAQVNSTVPAAERQEALAAAAEGKLEFVFVAPEQLARPEVLDRLRAARPSLFVVDEAHCVSEWGHYFRPDYLRLADAVADLGNPRVLALTATAAPAVRKDIVSRLGMRDARTVLAGADRPNLWLEVRGFEDARTKRRQLLSAVLSAQHPGIVYVARRKDADSLAGELCEQGARAVAYHAGMSAADRQAAQDAFMSGAAEVVVATSAFGLGVDRADVRFVHHLHVPDSVDAYWQEAGRAGRDGEPADVVLFYRPADLGLQRFFRSRLGANAADVGLVLSALAGGETDLAGLARACGLSRVRLSRVVGVLSDLGAVQVRGGRVMRGRADPPDGSREPADTSGEPEIDPGPDARWVAAAMTELERRRDLRRSRVTMMRTYAETNGCRRAVVLELLGEAAEEPCGNCDRCVARHVPTVDPGTHAGTGAGTGAGTDAGTDTGTDAGTGAGTRAGTGDEDATARPFPLGSPVRHETFWPGTVEHYEEGLSGLSVVVLFESSGYRTLDLGLVEREGLLTAAS